MKNILEYIERSVAKFPQKAAFVDSERGVTYNELYHNARAIGTALSALGKRNCPVAVYVAKSVNTLCAMFGVTYSGNFYTVVDTEMPVERVEKIFSTLSPIAIIADRDNYQKALTLLPKEQVLLYDDAIATNIDEDVEKRENLYSILGM